MSEDDRTPVGLSDDTPTPAEPPVWRSLVRVLTNHVASLEDVKQRVSALAALIEQRAEPPRLGELAALGRAFRDESDSATDVARQVEAIGRSRRGVRGGV
jgi:hypothetical protein